MSQENVEVVKRAIAAVNERGVDSYLSRCTNEVQLSTPVAAVAGVYEGPDGIRRFFADLGDTTPTSNSLLNVWRRSARIGSWPSCA